MDEERNGETAAREASEGPQEAVGGEDIAREVNRLVEAMAGAVSSAWNSSRWHQLEAELRDCLGTLVDNLEEALNRFGRSEQGQELQDQATRVASRVRESALAAEVKDGLVQGLRTAADEVQRFAANFEESQSKAGPTQDIEVEVDPDESREDKE
ncbi:MAG: hypothetical protein OXF76_10765 [Caldilineaceae bacterium]|nr:hypothetical protein [Caldilineaceae bacterium]